MVARAATWRPIPGFAPYEASELGEIRSSTPRYRIKPVELWLAELVGERIERRADVLRPWTVERHGRTAAYVTLFIAGQQHKELVHRLVALAWHGEPPTPEHTDVAHKDHDSLNNRASNLEWSTHADNIQANYDREERRFIEEESLASVLAPHGECVDVPF